MKRVPKSTKTNPKPSLLSVVILSLPVLIFVMPILWFLANPNQVQAFNNNNGRNLPFCDTTMTPSWDPCGIYYEWIGRRWFVADPNGCGGMTKRTFYIKKDQQERLQQAYQAAVTRMIQGFDRHKAAKRAHSASGIEITYADMQKAYAFDSDFIESYVYPENMTMDMGVEDPEFTAPQHWTMPAGLEFSTLERKIVDPKDTPHGDSAPEATHCLYVKSPNRDIDVYEYYRLDEDGLWSAGWEAEELNLSDYGDDEIMTLPLDYYTDYQSGSGEAEDWQVDGDTTWYDDTDYCVDAWYYWSEAYGTLNTPDNGPIEVIKIAYQWIYSEWRVDEGSEDGTDTLVDFDNGTEIYFYSKDGHQLMISIDSLGVETTGLVKPDFVYYQKVHKSESSVAENQVTTSPMFALYPNPTSGMINFNSPLSFDMYDVLGRQVLSQHDAMQADLSHLSRGMYFIKPHKGMVQKLLIQK